MFKNLKQLANKKNGAIKHLCFLSTVIIEMIWINLISIYMMIIVQPD